MDRVAGAGQGRVVRVNGPLVEIEGAEGLSMLELMALGPSRIAAETVAIAGTRATLQAYEYTGGLKAGDIASASGGELSGFMGPGMLGQVFDGLMRPLSSAPMWLGTGHSEAAAGTPALARYWTFVPTAAVGTQVTSGDVLGSVPESGAVIHRVLVPAGVAGELSWLAPEGALRGSDSVAVVAGRRVALTEPTPIRRPRPFRKRLTDAVPLHTGQRVLDLLFPLARGSAATVPGGFGTGKTMMLQQIAKWSDADVIVYIGCGERGNEMADVLDGFSQLEDSRTGRKLLERTVIIANTSNMPMMAREASIFSGIAVAEYYRDMGYDVVVIADSTSRWAEALREFANRNGDLPAEEGYPANLASALAAFYERAGRVTTLGGTTASITIIGAVSPPGGDMSEPVTTDSQRFVRALWMLDRDLAYSRHYPAVSWTGSFARDAVELGAWQAANGQPGWATRRARALALLTESDRLAELAEIIGLPSLPGPEQVLLLGGRLLRDGVLMQNALSPHDGYSSAEKGAALLDLVFDVVDACQRLVERGVAASTIESADFGPVLRAREECGPSDDAAVRARGAEVLAALEALQ
ncbi:V-type ATP synthase subunit A [Arthrobacter wenxiniae]|uniref:V-type ATP synthase subunit A n=1 Tax=Arthrobacter wenxiniae TaxID=2713570 RepID=A0A7Y7LZ41_9MICC|nr:V-type ATP synthase subunit A [Arthrobacter wenxiniae]NVM94226.1 V-type ATP synthase subunit A [Arthrobacter wenxiniae]